MLSTANGIFTFTQQLIFFTDFQKLSVRLLKTAVDYVSLVLYIYSVIQKYLYAKHIEVSFRFIIVFNLSLMGTFKMIIILELSSKSEEQVGQMLFCYFN